MKSRFFDTTLLAFALLAGCLSAVPRAADQDAGQGPDQLFPTPERGMTIPGSAEGEWSLEELLVEFGAASGEHLIWTAETRGLLRAIKTGLDRDLEIAPNELYSIVESVLLVHGFALADLRRAEPRLMRVISLRGGERFDLKGQARFVPEEDLPRYASHPGLMITTTLQLENLDVRTLTNSMRQIVSDPNTLMFTPVPEASGVIVAGFPDTVIGLTRLLRVMNDFSQPSRPVPPPPGATPLRRLPVPERASEG